VREVPSSSAAEVDVRCTLLGHGALALWPAIGWRKVPRA